MEERNITERESIELIASMIQNSKRRMELGSGNVLISWGYVTTIVALIVGIGHLTTGHVEWLWLWFAIPAIGYPLHYFLGKRKERKELVKTAIDRYISGIWVTIGLFFATLMVICFIFGMNGLNAWGVMFLLTLPCCGFGCLATGIILKEWSLIAGGLISMILGSLFMMCYVCRIDIFGYDIFAFALAFALMMIVPGHIINHKARKASC
ncbi:MAG: hypothetical protein IKA19_04350 [Muribaculaceae bacterium]|nr:hypothetical protein [Muribaculaceae bacterium]MBR1963907.1 hypothetical protein [Muribaculaceae bacterium]